MSVSMAVHVFLVVVLFVVPKDWFVTAKTPPRDHDHQPRRIAR
jgi:hypothetical protein